MTKQTSQKCGAMKPHVVETNQQTNKTRKETHAGKVKRHGGIYHSASILWEFRREHLQGERQQLEEEDGPPELGNRGISPA